MASAQNADKISILAFGFPDLIPQIFSGMSEHPRNRMLFYNGGCL